MEHFFASGQLFMSGNGEGRDVHLKRNVWPQEILKTKGWILLQVEEHTTFRFPPTKNSYLHPLYRSKTKVISMSSSIYATPFFHKSVTRFRNYVGKLSGIFEGVQNNSDTQTRRCAARRTGTSGKVGLIACVRACMRKFKTNFLAQVQSRCIVCSNFRAEIFSRITET